MARQSKKWAYVICPLKRKIIWGLVTYFNKIKYDQHTAVGSIFVYNLNTLFHNTHPLTKTRK